MEDRSKIRWVQRFGNFAKSLAMLEKYVEKNSLGELEKPGLIKLFETTFEQAWLTVYFPLFNQLKRQLQE